MDDKSIELVRTADGSYTLYRGDMHETYHSRHGSRSESMHVFIEAGLRYTADQDPRDSLRLLEVGLGTGLNAYLTAVVWGAENPRKLHYVGLEPYPLPTGIWQSLGEKDPTYTDKRLFREIHLSPFNSIVPLLPAFVFEKQQVTLQDYVASEPFDLVYFDAFGYRAQEEMWGATVFQKLHQLMTPGAILVTYAAKGMVRRNMQEMGWAVERLPGPRGKREMLRATRIA